MTELDQLDATPPPSSYGCDPFGLLMSDTESFANGWSNPYRYDGRDGVRYDRETGLYWMSVRAYDPALGRFLARDPLGRSPLFFADQPYVYAGNNPLVNVDPSGQRVAPDITAGLKKSEVRALNRIIATRFRVRPHHPCDNPKSAECKRMRHDAWAYRQLPTREKHLASMKQTAAWMLIGGAIIALVADGITFGTEHNVVKLITTLIDVGSVVLELVGYVALLGVDTGQFGAIVGAGHMWIAAAKGALGIMQKLGVFGEAAVAATIFGFKAAAGGVIGAFVQLLYALGGNALTTLISTGASLLYSGGALILGQWQYEMSQSIDVWCGTHKGVCELPPN